MRISRQLSKKWFISLPCIWHITAPWLALTSHVVKSIHRNSHTTLLTFVWETPWFVCLYHTDSRASTTIYPVHVLVCLRATCSIHTAWMNLTTYDVSTSPKAFICQICVRKINCYVDDGPGFYVRCGEKDNYKYKNKSKITFLNGQWPKNSHE